MTSKELFLFADYTQLNPYASWESIREMCDEAVQFDAASVCIPPAYVDGVKNVYGDQLKICTVVGFPFGYNETSIKAAETEEALRRGAEEIDMVINIGNVKNGIFGEVGNEIEVIRGICGSSVLKVIVEAGYLTEEEKIAVCSEVTEAGADFISTCTGFGAGGTTVADIELIRKHIGENVKIKASGSMKNARDLELFLQAGCQRIGLFI